METTTIDLLNEVNLDFYARLAPSFSATRQRVQNGVRRIAALLPEQIDLLDVGCGNGNFGTMLAREGKTGRYVGIDFSSALMDEHTDVGQDAGLTMEFAKVDLVHDDLREAMAGQGFAQVTAFAVFHHIPGEANRVRAYGAINGLLPMGGLFVQSNWQFLNSPRLAKRVQDWGVIGLSQDDVEEHDYLLDWRRDGSAFRFVHHYDVDELKGLAPKAGFAVQDVFFSDGQGGNLGMYQIWEKVAEVTG